MFKQVEGGGLVTARFFAAFFFLWKKFIFLLTALVSSGSLTHVMEMRSGVAGVWAAKVSFGAQKKGEAVSNLSCWHGL